MKHRQHVQQNHTTKSKKESEKDILQIGLPHCCMRLATFYGPEMRAALAPAVFIDKAHRKETIEIHGSGNQTKEQ